MSSDDAVYVLATTTGLPGQCEYRVAWLVSPYWDDQQAVSLFRLFDEAPVFNTTHAAMEYARHLASIHQPEYWIIEMSARVPFKHPG